MVNGDSDNKDEFEDAFMEVLGRFKNDRNKLQAEVNRLRIELKTANDRIEELDCIKLDLEVKISAREDLLEQALADVANYKEMYEREKEGRDTASEKCKQLVKDNERIQKEARRSDRMYHEILQECKSVSAMVASNDEQHADEVNALKTQLAERDAVANQLRASISEKDGRFSNLQNILSNVKQEVLVLKDEINSLRKQIESMTENHEKAIQELKASHESDLSSKNSASDDEIKKLRLENMEVMQRSGKMTEKIEKVKAMYPRDQAAIPDGTGLLLKSGSMLPFKAVAEQWLNSAAFDGTVGFPIRCPKTSLMTSVVHERAVLNFVRQVARTTELQTTYPFYFQYNTAPVPLANVNNNGSAQSGPPWKQYGPCDQLILVAKMIYIYKTKDSMGDSTRFFKVDLDEEGHHVHANCTKRPGQDLWHVQLTLNVFSKAGDAQKHRIRFKSNDQAPFFPVNFCITDGAV